MELENKLQAIVTDIATTAAQGFLSTLPPEVSQTLSPNFLNTLSEDVKADLQSVIHSRLLWSLQALKAELDEQQRQEQHRNAEPPPAVISPPMSARLPQAELRADPNLNDFPPSSQLEQPVTAELESLKPYQRHGGRDLQMSSKEIMKAYNLSPTDFTPRPARAVRRKSRTSIAMS